MLGARALLAGGIALLAVGVGSWVPIFQEYPALLWFGVFWALSRACSMIWYFQGRERMWLVAWLDIVTQPLAAGAIFVLVRKPADGWRVLGLQGLGFFLSFTVGLVLTYREVPIRSAHVEIVVGSSTDGLEPVSVPRLR